MKKRNLYIILIILALILIFVNSEDDNLRIRVIGNSDSQVDLNIKYQCVDVVKKYVNANDTKDDVIDAIPFINNELKLIEKKYSCKISTDLVRTVFPPKQLNGKIISGGEYETLLIKIGDAKGSNFWTLLYPEYFNITFDDIYSGEVEVKWFFKKIFN